VHQDDGSVDVYPSKVVKEKLEFTEGNFDIDNIDWVTDIQRLMNEYVLKDKAEVEVIENYG
jgi:ORF53